MNESAQVGMSGLKVLISGSGIASSVFATWLLRAYPEASITVVERHPSPRLTGASVDIRSSAVDIIKWMNVEQEIRKHSTKEEDIQFVNSKGGIIATLAATGNTDVQSMTSEYEIMRGTLAKIFAKPITNRVNLLFDDSVDTFEQRDDKVIVTFAKSGNVEIYDLLVAADGLGSKIRGTIVDSPPREQIYDEGVHISYFTIKKDMLQGSRLAKYYNAPGGRVVFLRPDPDPAGRTSCLLMNVTWDSNVETKKKLNDALREGNESYMKLMQEMFSEAGWIVPELLKSMPDSNDFYCSLFGQVRSPVLQDGRVVLLGDAGYATPGFGTSLAIIGGYILAGELSKYPGDVKTATKRYEEFMQPLVKTSQTSFPAMQLLNPQTSWGITIRNTLLRLVTWTKLDKLAIHVALMLGFSEKKLLMPEYQWLD